MWRKAPLRMVRSPRSFAALALVALVLGATTSSASLFTASAGSAAVDNELASLRPRGGDVTVEVFGSPSEKGFGVADARLREEASRITWLGRPQSTAIRSRQFVDVPGGARSTEIRLFFRTGARDHIEILQDAPGDGVWLAESVAATLGVRAGERFRLINGDITHPVRVAGIYRDLASSLPLSDYWADLTFDIIPAGANEPPPPPFLIADRNLFFELAQKSGDGLEYRWRLPLTARELTLSEARGLRDDIAGLAARASDPLTPVGKTFDELALFFGGAEVLSSFPEAVDRVDATVVSLEQSVRLLSLAGAVVSLFMVGAAAVFILRRRPSEVRLLLARGVGPAPQGLRVALESLLPVVVGTTAGWAAALGTVKALGPSTRIAGGEVVDAASFAALSAVAGIVLIAVVAGTVVYREGAAERGRGLQKAARAPWDVGALALAGVAFYEITTRESALIERPDGLPEADLLVLAFPILFIAGSAGLAVRGLHRLLPVVRSVRSSAPMPLFLAARRLSSVSSSGTLLMIAITLAVGVLAYAGALVASTDATVDAKALVSVGARSAIGIDQDEDLPGSGPFPFTRVIRNRADLFPHNTTVDVLAIHPPSFRDAAFWDTSLSPVSLDDMLERLQRPDRRRLPVVAAGADAGDAGTLELSGARIPATVVAHADAFPGMPVNRPVIVADADALSAAARRVGVGDTLFLIASHEVWADADLPVLGNWLRRNGVAEEGTLFEDADAIREQTTLKGVTWTFGFLEALGILAGAIAVLGLVFYVDSRQRARNLSYGLAARMGLSGRAHWAAMAIELAAMLAVSAVLGVSAALVAARLLQVHLDPLPELVPGPLFDVPDALIATLVPAAVAVSLPAALWVHRSARRARMAEVMRLAD